MIHVLQMTREFKEQVRLGGHNSFAGGIYNELTWTPNMEDEPTDRYLLSLTLAALGAAHNYERSSLMRVATVETVDLDEAFRLTQNRQGPWIDSSDKVKDVPDELRVKRETGGYGAPSASVGDIYIRDGVVYVIAGHGFWKIKDSSVTMLLQALAQGVTLRDELKAAAPTQESLEQMGEKSWARVMAKLQKSTQA